MGNYFCQQDEKIGEKPVLLYFPLRARCESIRMIAAYVGFDYEDQIVTMDEWGEMKKKMPKGQLPVLVKSDGTEMPESCDIALYIAENGKSGRSVVCDQVAKDLYAESQTPPMAMCMPLLNWFKKEEVMGQKLDSYLETAKAKFVEYDDLLGKSDGPFFAGGTPGLGDFGTLHVYANTIALSSNFCEETSLSDKFKTWVEKMRNLEGVKAYLDGRPKCGTGEIGAEGTISRLDTVTEI